VTAIIAPHTLAGPLASTRVRQAALVLGATLLTAVGAQISVPLPGTPVPVTLQTLTVLLVGGALGWRAGATSQVLYVALGALGLPLYAGGEGGWHAATNATAGYRVGFVLAAALVGALAERRQDRSLLTSLSVMVSGTVVIYLTGVTWLAHALGVSATRALELGFVPFAIGDVTKAAVAGALLPAAWRIVKR
jgi:biotin transport system substrate-specific component